MVDFPTHRPGSRDRPGGGLETRVGRVGKPTRLKASRAVCRRGRASSCSMRRPRRSSTCPSARRWRWRAIKRRAMAVLAWISTRRSPLARAISISSWEKKPPSLFSPSSSRPIRPRSLHSGTAQAMPWQRAGSSGWARVCGEVNPASKPATAKSASPESCAAAGPGG